VKLYRTRMQIEDAGNGVDLSYAFYHRTGNLNAEGHGG
jgi:hypothetical protein